MKKTILLSVFLCWVLCNLLAQQVWHKNLWPALPLDISFCRLHIEDVQYLLSTNDRIFQIDESGVVTGYMQRPSGSGAAVHWTSVVKKRAANNGHPYFLISRCPSTPSSDYSIVEHRPGVGVTNTYSYTDTSTAPTGTRPIMVPMSDSTYLLFANKFYRKIKHTEGGGFVEEWSRPLDMSVVHVLPYNDGFLVSNTSQQLVALNLDGEEVWRNKYDYRTHSIAVVSGGFIVCGQVSDSHAVVAKLDDNGIEIWKKETPDKRFLDIAATNNGGSVLTGESDSSKAVLIRLDANGGEVWRTTFIHGVGAQVSRSGDGGFVVAVRGYAPNEFRLIKTDGMGFTAATEERILIQERRIQTDNIQATFPPNASLFYDRSNHATLLSLKDNNTATIFAASPWIAALDENDSLFASANDYFFFPNSDFRPGTTKTQMRDFERVWATNRAEINRLRLDFGTDQFLNHPVPFDVLTWPAKGNPHLQYNLDFTPVTTPPDLFPAPFVDANSDGIYNVYDGDYPLIKGDQMAWWVFTDSTKHNRSESKSMGLDVFASVHAYDCTKNELIDKSLLAEFEFVNRFDKNYKNAFFGLFIDFDLGCYHDDHFGSLPEANTLYVYNQSANDTLCFQGIVGFGSNIPVQTATFINRSMDYSMCYLSSGLINFPPVIDPQLPAHFYHYLQGKWRDGNFLNFGGMGYEPNGANPTSHVFPDNPSNPTGWTMCSANLAYADRRTLMSHGPFTFAAGDAFRVSTLFTLHPDIPHPCPDIFGLVKPNIEQLQQWHDDGSLSASVDLGQVVKLPPGQNITLNATIPNASYIWSSGETSPTINVAQPGTYSVTITPTTGCQIVETVLVQLGTSIAQPDHSPAWSIRPNPARDFIWVDCPECLSAEGTWRTVLRNAQGIPVLATQGLRVQARDLSPGFYWLELWHDGRFLGSRKVVVVR
ncbi:MAG: PQQ-binding-like beta-propeller repeat protein [Saprospiraceae bacterium]|nr:PQQ-binding-like beta-propeller repeat protein [Saprospiraceae bacterium]